MTCCPDQRGGDGFDPDWEGPSEEDIARFGGETFACPDCGEEIYDEAPFCPRCGRVTVGDSPVAHGAGKAFFLTALGVAALIAFVLAFAL